MIIVQSEIMVKGLSGKAIADFLLNCNDQVYQKWWPGMHLAFHTVKGFPNHIGDVVYMDEFVGKYRIKMKGVVTGFIPDKEIVWQFKAIIKLPVRLFLGLEETREGVKITHAIKAGYNGIGRFLDPVFELYFTKDFAKAMDEHARIEFPKLREVLF